MRAKGSRSHCNAFVIPIFRFPILLLGADAGADPGILKEWQFSSKREIQPLTRDSLHWKESAPEMQRIKELLKLFYNFCPFFKFLIWFTRYASASSGADSIAEDGAQWSCYSSIGLLHGVQSFTSIII